MLAPNHDADGRPSLRSRGAWHTISLLGHSAETARITDLGCSLYVRGKKIPDLGGRLEESLTVDEQIDRTRAKLSAFLDKVLA